MAVLNDPIKCGPRPRLRKWRDLPNEKLTRAERVMRFIEDLLPVPEGKLVGQPIVLAPFQERFIRALYDNPAGTRRAYLSKARKNSKTATIACIVLAHLVGPEAHLNSQIQSGARSRDQAAQVFNYASKMVQLSPTLSEIVRIVPSSKRLIGTPMNVEYRALSADAKTAHGGSPILAILDEVGQVRGPHDDFIDAIETSQGAHDAPLLIAISTQAANDADLFSIWLDAAERDQDPTIVSHLYATPIECDLMDRKGWEASNPALGLFRSRKDLESQARDASRMPSKENSFRNLCLNQRISTVAPFVSPEVWKSCGGTVADFGDAEVYGGLDLSARTDLTALALIAQIDGIWCARPYFWTPEDGIEERAKRDRVDYRLWVKQGLLRTTPGKTVDYEYVAREIAEICAELNIKAIGYDRWRIELLRKEFEKLGIDTSEGGALPLVPHGQGFKDMAPAIDTLEAELLNGRIAHGAHPVLTMCAVNAVITKDSAGNRKLDKHKATGRIDGMVSLAMAMGSTQLNAVEPEPEYKMFFI
jgi:phage terminase large subunit-like protein